jgi:hypothetical protein
MAVTSLAGRGFNVARLQRWVSRIDSQKVKLASERSLDRIIELTREAVGFAPARQERSRR